MFQQGAHEEAIRDFSKVIELHSLATVACNNRGYNYQQIEKNAEAIVDYNKAIELTPGDALAYQNRARLLAVCKQRKLAILNLHLNQPRKPANRINSTT